MPKLALAEDPHKPGSLVKINQTVYLLSASQKRGFQSLNEFLTYHYRASRIMPANVADLFLFEGPPMRAKPGTLALDTSDGHTIYLIGKDGEKRGFVSAAAFRKYRKKSSVVWPIDLSSYPIGKNIE